MATRDKRIAEHERPVSEKSIAPLRRIIAVLLPVIALAGIPPAAAADDAERIGRTPPRLSFLEGEVSFWRQGEQDWMPALRNTALAPGDLLYTGPESRLEAQIGGHAFVRADANTELEFENQQRDLVRLRLQTGRATLDLESIGRGERVELDTPHAAFSIERPGYYRFETDDEATALVVRRGGRAVVVTRNNGLRTEVGSERELVIDGADRPGVVTRRASERDRWDLWNYDRTGELLHAESERYLPADMYGVHELDRHGRWRVEEPYGRVWVPAARPTGWVPYSTGRWMWDPYYEWTWVDDAPWGWVPYHFGRWVYLDGFWAWTPGPIPMNLRPTYAPALVVFLASPGTYVPTYTPFISWVALDWGEPLVPWWGPAGFIGRPWWGGWHGPCLINHRAVDRRKRFKARDITGYGNARRPKAVVGIPIHESKDGRRIRNRLEHPRARRLEPVHGVVPIRPGTLRPKSTAGDKARPPKRKLRPAPDVPADRARRMIAVLPDGKRHRARARIPTVVGPGRDGAAPSVVSRKRREPRDDRRGAPGWPRVQRDRRTPSSPGRGQGTSDLRAPHREHPGATARRMRPHPPRGRQHGAAPSYVHDQRPPRSQPKTWRGTLSHPAARREHADRSMRQTPRQPAHSSNRVVASRRSVDGPHIRPRAGARPPAGAAGPRRLDVASRRR